MAYFLFPIVLSFIVILTWPWEQKVQIDSYWGYLGDWAEHLILQLALLPSALWKHIIVRIWGTKELSFSQAHSMTWEMEPSNITLDSWLPGFKHQLSTLLQMY